MLRLKALVAIALGLGGIITGILMLTGVIGLTLASQTLIVIIPIALIIVGLILTIFGLFRLVRKEPSNLASFLIFKLEQLKEYQAAKTVRYIDQMKEGNRLIVTDMEDGYKLLYITRKENETIKDDLSDLTTEWKIIHTLDTPLAKIEGFTLAPINCNDSSSLKSCYFNKQNAWIIGTLNKKLFVEAIQYSLKKGQRVKLQIKPLMEDSNGTVKSLKEGVKKAFLSDNDSINDISIFYKEEKGKVRGLDNNDELLTNLNFKEGTFFVKYQ